MTLLPYRRELLRRAGVGLGFALAVLRTLIVCCPAAAVCSWSSGYFFVLGQIKRQG
jgi:hypothetical protein